MTTELEDSTTVTAPKVTKYKVVSVEKTDPPEGLPEGNWHRYIIGHGRSKIEGLKPGTLSAVKQHAESVASDLNERTGKGGSTYAPRKQKSN